MPQTLPQAAPREGSAEAKGTTMNRASSILTTRWSLNARALLVGAVVAGALLSSGIAVPTAQAVDGGAYIANSESGVRLRAEPSLSGEILDVIMDGNWVDFRTDELATVVDVDGNEWWPVIANGMNGWIASGYFSDSAVTGTLQAWSGSAEAESLNGASSAVVSEADGVNLRVEPSTGAESLGVLAYGQYVDLMTADQDTVWSEGLRWWPVSTSLGTGWVAGDFLAPESSAGSAADDGSSVQGWSETYYQVVTDDGSGVNIRADAAPDAELVGSAQDGTLLSLVDGPAYDPIGNEWWLVNDGSVTGWVFGEYLQESAFSPNSGPATGVFMYPVDAFRFTQGFGCSQFWWNYAYNPAWGCNVHDGIDLAAPAYTDIFAADGGVVEEAGWCDCGYGWYVKIDHQNGFKSLYGHMAEAPLVSKGESVWQGEHIGELGTTGNSTGYHLHFAIESGGAKVDPLIFLP